MWNGLHTHTNTHLSTDQTFYCHAVLLCRQVASHHLTCDEAAFLEGNEMLFWNWRE